MMSTQSNCYINIMMDFAYSIGGTSHKILLENLMIEFNML